MKTFLPISLTSQIEPHAIPCVLPDATFTAHLPTAGLRVITTAWTTKHPVTARVDPLDFEVRREDEEGNLQQDIFQSDADRTAAIGAARRILEAVLRHLGLDATTRKPLPHASLSPVMQAISDAWDAELDAVGAAGDLALVLRQDADENTAAAVDDATVDLSDPTTTTQVRSPACVALRGYVQTVTDRECEKLTLDAEREASEAREEAPLSRAEALAEERDMDCRRGLS